MDNKGRLKEIINIIIDNKVITDRSPENIRKTLEDLGPTFIKIGQILSTRVDLLSSKYVLELSKLRSEVTPIGYDEILNLLRKEYSDFDSVFVSVSEKPIGCASIAQVHLAKTKKYGNVILKIKRPNIDDEIKEDIKLLKEAVKVLKINHIFKVVDLEMVLDEIYSTTLKELDFVQEVDNMLEFAKNNVSEKYISCPFVYSDICSKNVIAMEYIKGIMISDIEGINKANYNKKLIAKELSKNYIKQALDDGMFHADPHPDNICLSKGKIVFLDWGMVGTLTDKNRNLLSDCMRAIVYEDYDRVADDLIRMSTKNGNFVFDNLVKDIENILGTFSDLSLDSIDSRKFMIDMFNMLRNNNLILDYDVTMLVRGICIVEAVLKDIDPSTSLLEVLRNKVLDDGIRSFVSKNNLSDVGKKVYKSGNSVLEIPIQFNKFMKSILNSNFKFKFELSDSSKHVDKIENLVHEIILGFIDGCLILSYSFCNSSCAKLIFLIFIIFISAWLLFKMIFDILHKGY